MTGYTAPSTGRTVRAVLFDTFGTVVDWRSGISSAVRAFAADRALTLDPEEFADPGTFAPGELTSLTTAWRYLPTLARQPAAGRNSNPETGRVTQVRSLL